MRLFVYCIIPVTVFYYFFNLFMYCVDKMYVETKIKFHRKSGNLLPFRPVLFSPYKPSILLWVMGKQYGPRSDMT